MRDSTEPTDTSRASRGHARRVRAAAERRAALLVLSALGLAAVVGIAIWSGVGRPGSASIAPGSSQVAQADRSAQSAATRAKTAGSLPHVKTASIRRAARPKLPARPKAPVTAASKPKPSTRAVAAAPATAAKAKSRTVASVASAAKGTVTIETFGYDYGGPPSGSKFVADVRNIDAGNFTSSQTGLMASVRKRVMATAAAKTWHTVMKTKWLPKLKSGDKVAIGCARGHHRSVSLAIVFAEDLKAKGFSVKFVHRDILKTW